MPYLLSYWLVTKRLLKSLFVHPAGWPEGCSVLQGTLQSYRTLKLCPKFWNADFTAKLTILAAGKSLHIIQTLDELEQFIVNACSTEQF
ncbi:hypothetical protein ACFOEE_07230 [Pseudoalteromonas fenneropenaei]|uniref:Uncharacterized protein n=1 Tax=Pseudoalteromonas fenneropenaei TaxID=1737459 RepID=A0ABV7CI63_9GAMM